jgi:hypothetical protein
MAPKSISMARGTVALVCSCCHAALIALVATACGNGTGAPNAARELIKPQAQLHVSSTATSLGVDGGTPIDISSIQAYLDSFYTTADIRHSFTTKFGEQVDCIDFYAQRSVKGFLAQGVQITDQNWPTKIPGDSGPTSYPTSPAAFDGAPDENGNARACPAGSVPSRRPTLEQVQSAGGVDAFLSAVSLAERHRPQAPESTQEYDCYQYTTGGPSFDHATAYQDFPSTVSGMLTFTPIYNPTLEFPTTEHSVSQIWMQTGTCEFDDARNVSYNCTTGSTGNAVQSVEAGWIVGNGFSAGPHLIVFTTQDGYHVDNCFAGGFNENCCPLNKDGGFDTDGTDCFVAFSTSNYEVGQALSFTPPGQTPTEMAIQVWNPGYNNPWGYLPGWYIYINGVVIGGYPSGAFAGPGKTGQLQYSATYMQVGGEVFDEETNGTHTTTQMGSGKFFGSSGSPYGSAAYHRNVSYLQGETYHSASLSYVSDAPNAAGMCGWQASNWYGRSTTYAQGPGASWVPYFYYGGPQ